ncbi:MAG: hypothetical protein QGI33_03955 [Candidatus Brocadiia bacterium]|jgi:hypothetical protein|nr:hypothetical protein [Candidatus Brocadiia bacterium]
MAVKLQAAYEEAAKAQERLAYFVEELQWKKAKTGDDVFHGALCSGILALSKQQEIMIQLLLRYLQASSPGGAEKEEATE